MFKIKESEFKCDRGLTLMKLGIERAQEGSDRRLTSKSNTNSETSKNGKQLTDNELPNTKVMLQQLIGDGLLNTSACDTDETTKVTSDDEVSTAYDSDKDPEYVVSDDQISISSLEETAVAIEDENVVNTNNEKIKTRKRLRKSEQWKCNVRKRRKDCGEEYTSKTGKTIAAKKIKPPCLPSCKRKCIENISESDRQCIFKNYWRQENNNDFKRQFVANNVCSVPVTRRVVATINEPRRNLTLQYFFDIRNKKVQVCKTFFLNTLGISEMTVKTVLKKKKDCGIVSPDKRGKKPPPNKLSDDVRDTVRTHIKSFPVIESHYSRERTTKQYLGNELTISKMYLLYIEDCKRNNLHSKMIAKEWLYNTIFNTEFNLSFKQPSNDTCDTCDAFLTQIKNSKGKDEDSEQNLQTNYALHLEEAKRRYAIKREDKIASKESNAKKICIMIDLQKCLPTPYLTNSQAFYLRKLWTLNLTIFNATSDKSHCAMWDETVGGRGGCEVASCILKWALDNVNNETEELTIWSDNCAGQNRNFILIACYVWLLRILPNLKIVNHKFLLKGHTHMEVDGVHSVIERAKQKLGNSAMMTPWDWQQFVRQCRFKDLIEVYNMTLEDLKNFKMLFDSSTSPLINRKKTTENEAFLISEVVHMQLRSSESETLFYKTSFDEHFKTVDLKRCTRRGTNWPDQLDVANSVTRPISVKKYQDLQTSLKWVPSCFHEYYKNMSCSNSASDYPE